MKNIFVTAFMLMLFVLGLLQSGCTTQRKVEKFLKNNPDVASKYCAEAYPVIEKFIKGKDSVVVDSVVRRDTVTIIRTINGKADTIKVPCPPCNAKTKTVYRTDTLYKENTAKLASMTIDFNKYYSLYGSEKEARVEAEKKAKSRLWCLVGVGALVCVYIGLKIKKVLPF